jgi:alpha 1,2-mannosyltransferase
LNFFTRRDIIYTNTMQFGRATSKIVSSKVQYGLIPQEHWLQPPSIDEEKAKESRDRMVDEGVHYAASVSCVFFPLPRNSSDLSFVRFRYRNMCRFNSGVRRESSYLGDGASH